MIAWMLIAAASAAASGPDPYAAGVKALEEKDPAAAIGHLIRCVEAEPLRVDCRWELGWGYWLKRDWARVVSEWEMVRKLAPDHPELQKNLDIARSQLELAEQLMVGRNDAPATVSDTPKASRLRLRAVGDVMLGTDFPAGYLPPDGGAHLLSSVSDALRDADLTFVNLEGPLCDGGDSDKCRAGGNCYAFRTPTSYGKHLSLAGVDLVSTANNHSSDFGEGCRRETERVLDELGIAWSGPVGSVASVTHEGLQVAMIAFHTAPQCNWVNDQATAEKMVGRAAATHDIVIVSFHGGAEGRKALRVPRGRETFYGENRGDLRKFAHGVVDAGADLVLGHGPHVPRAMEIYRGRLIAYSLGNFATYGRFNLSGPLGLGLILEVEVDETGAFLAGRILPTHQVGRGVPRHDAKGEVIDLVRLLSKQDFPRTGVVVARDGTIAARRKR